METYQSIYAKIVNACASGKMNDDFKAAKELSEAETYHLDCLLHPEKCAPVIAVSECECDDAQKRECEEACDFGALTHDQNGRLIVSGDSCVGCGACIDHCIKDSLVDRKDLWPLFERLNKGSAPVYALIAPAFLSQFGSQVSAGHLRSAFKKIGFAGMIEVALFADILTLKEALEFDRYIHSDEDFLLTSCCCPVWIGMIRKIYNQLVPHIPPSVSPMVASGRAIKELYPNAITVFIGPCIAKKAEAREKNIADAVDYVLTFQEIIDIFNAAGVKPEDLDEDTRDHSSMAGRIYARTGGVSEAVQRCVQRLKPDRPIQVKALQADGVPALKALLKEINEGLKLDANFLEGMGCKGGCVGGPKVIIDRQEGTEHVNEYGSRAAYETPADNPFVLEMLKRLGYDTIESLLEKDQIFTRHFDT